ncbi:hypothetical protein EHI8A_154230 [Entamoeba histolytica HM-1:IMSS-B]|uniref:Uncharacterized protein n=5 Tax=Entamoeba histolytica TaxID=5759 RepID=C4M3Q5_ENTH1|nr:hypothetical protein EHI_146110 [Entamoeba histolytica HM-1:IMSS]EMH75714.1 hypothetical protein EHI8A_154230 [Entamoeba histolytica HM-1:IMSS-B]EMS16057.1 hypothetical protein KM1_247950 [Entamoeba histolytica HM-3:IMSS]ENY62996.1 hypothetical protein EHI7A_139770 [Entamoeba histolytica HM-1:IMSS-A]BAN38429.1 hypothetical protein [Entamoeba histolytica]EAL44502.1 hypothetical protein EHI_146110 [Entamoeba histolytica HM-1:IMSS]|eukprot:XP_649888.1 hypothetical protein EHI_146110 [Entamoeba histolytica HM-1:IMSS]
MIALINILTIISVVAGHLYSTNDFEALSELEDKEDYRGDSFDEDETFMDYLEGDDFMMEDDLPGIQLTKKLAEGAIGSLQTGAISAIDKETKYLAENGDTISQRMDRIGDIAGKAANVLEPVARFTNIVGPGIRGKYGRLAVGAINGAAKGARAINLGARGAASITRYATGLSKQYQNQEGTPEEKVRLMKEVIIQNAKDEGKKLLANGVGALAGKAATVAFGNRIVSGGGKVIDGGMLLGNRLVGKGMSGIVGRAAKEYLAEKVNEKTDMLKNKVTDNVGQFLGVNPSTSGIDIDKIKEGFQVTKDFYKNGQSMSNVFMQPGKNRRLRHKQEMKHKKSVLQRTNTLETGVGERNLTPTTSISPVIHSNNQSPSNKNTERVVSARGNRQNLVRSTSV